jgi:hypothetical protein
MGKRRSSSLLVQLELIAGLGSKLCESKLKFGLIAHVSDAHIQWLKFVFSTRADRSGILCVQV